MANGLVGGGTGGRRAGGGCDRLILRCAAEIRPGRKVMLLHLEPSVDEGKQEQAAATRDNHTEASPEPADPV